MEIRSEQLEDIEAVRRLNSLAFGRSSEEDIEAVRRLNSLAFGRSSEEDIEAVRRLNSLAFGRSSEEDIEAVRRLNSLAFGRSSEADLVDRLRGIASTLSFVAVESGQILGHIFFSPVTITPTNTVQVPETVLEELPEKEKFIENLFLLGLAPVAVLPEVQRQGIGSALIQYGLAECDKFGCQAVVVLGHPEYYPRFGFRPAKGKGLQCEYDVPPEAFMVRELVPGALAGIEGVVKYRSEFQDCE